MFLHAALVHGQKKGCRHVSCENRHATAVKPLNSRLEGLEMSLLAKGKVYYELLRLSSTPPDL